MRLQGVELRRIRMSLVAPFETSFGVQTERDILLVKVITTDGEGWGECVAGEEPTYSSEYVDGAHLQISQCGRHRADETAAGHSVLHIHRSLRSVTFYA